MMARPKGKRPEAEIRSAIEEFMAGEKLNAIADRYGVRQPTVSYWIHKWGEAFFPGQFKLRKQGRRKDLAPNKRDQNIMRMVVEGKSSGQIAMKYAISRTRVAAICKTWGSRGYKVPEEVKCRHSNGS
jgi:transposase